jgi:hypothetical protein
VITAFWKGFPILGRQNQHLESSIHLSQQAIEGKEVSTQKCTQVSKHLWKFVSTLKKLHAKHRDQINMCGLEYTYHSQ